MGLGVCVRVCMRYGSGRGDGRVTRAGGGWGRAHTAKNMRDCGVRELLI